MQSLQYTRLPWSTLARSPLAHSPLTYMLERKAHQDFTFWIVQCDLFTVRCVAHCVYHIVLYISLCNVCVCVFLDAMACNVHTVESLQLISVKLCFRWLAQKTEWEKKRWRINRETSFTRAQVIKASFSTYRCFWSHISCVIDWVLIVYRSWCRERSGVTGMWLGQRSSAWGSRLQSRSAQIHHRLTFITKE